MALLFTFVLVVHGLIHVMGFAKAFGLAELPELTQPITRPMGALWLVAGALFVASAVSLHVWPRGFWIVGGAAIVLSQIVIASSWHDARFGTLANAIALAGAVYGFASQGPLSQRAQYQADVAIELARPRATGLLTEADLAPLPRAVAKYLRVTGAVGEPRITSFRLRYRGQIRSGPDARWMDIAGEQHNFYGAPARLFFLDASLLGVPFEVFHRFVGDSATMRVKIASLLPMVDAKGPEMTRAETVTIFNDMCVLAPATLVDPGIRWREIDPTTARATFTHAGNTIEADLFFDASGDLVDFRSEDRSAASADGKSFTKMPWSTPIHEYRRFGARRIGSRAEARWHAKEGAFDYLRFEIVEIVYNVGR